MKKLLLLTLFLALSAVIFAQPPTTIPGKIAYQGKLLENDIPVTGTRTIEFSIPGTGWTETHNNVVIEKGLYSVQLGSITPIPTAVFSSPTASLDIAVEGTTLSPQVELLSVPYAYKADNAAKIAGNSVSTTIPAIGQTLQWDGTAWVPGDTLQTQIDELKAQVEQLLATGGGGPETVTDIDGIVYQTVQIGNQMWMAENLKTTHYANGEEIPDGTGAGNINGETDPKYWFAYNDDLNNVSAYGRLYTWYTVMDNRNICPTGWHVPTDAEWTELADYLGGIDAAGGKLKETGTALWRTPNTGATNESGFTALPGGVRYTDKFNYMGDYGWYWSATESSIINAWDHYMYYNNSTIVRTNFTKKAGYSVRCVKD